MYCQYPYPSLIPSLSWPALPCPGLSCPSGKGYYTKFAIAPHPKELSVFLLLLMGFGLVFLFSPFLLTNSFQPNFEIPIVHLNRLYSCSDINIRQYTFKLDSTYLNQIDQIVNVVFFQKKFKISFFCKLKTSIQITH